jgi:hypothetical protein
VFTCIEHSEIMNDDNANLLQAAAGHLRARDLTVAIKKPRRDEHIDAWFRVTKDKTHTDYAVEIKRQVTPQTLGAVVAQLKRWDERAKNQPLLVTTHITPPVADRLTQMHQQFVDAAGNAYLNVPGMFVLITGRKPEKDTIVEKPERAFTAAGLKTLFVLICNPELAAAPYREIAAAADVALGALPNVLAGLQRAGHLHVMGHKRRLVATKRLLDEWALAYARKLRPKQLLRTLVATTFETWRNWDLQTDRARWGGEPAAALLTRYLEPGVLTIYAEKVPARLMVEHRMTTARPHDGHNLVEVRTPFWGEGMTHTDRPDLVPPALVYADLLATGDARCIETAQLIYEKYLARHFTAT